MSHRITVGLDGSPRDRASARWAAAEAALHGADLQLLHVDDRPRYAPFAAPPPESCRRSALASAPSLTP
ncbi:universal stress protein [Streptomyces sp. CG 926]|uniref:universal stress protein n=1 Tax=Streptomyces sp. CG 926 TaxID=1882405 RepID=UPI000D6B11A5|nr:universal stress protein [Streptomyces sp. CG 926]